MRFYWLLLGVLSVWRITHLLQAEDGPWGIVVRFRRLAGDTFWGELLDCFYCLSAWVAVPFALDLGTEWKERLLLWPALSAAAILLERITVPPVAAFSEDLSEATTEETTVACCGNQRMTVRSDKATRPQPDTMAKTVRNTHVSFQYVGMTGLTALGAATGARYRFESPGAIVAVDLRDEASLRPIPQLRRVYLA